MGHQFREAGGRPHGKHENQQTHGQGQRTVIGQMQPLCRAEYQHVVKDGDLDKSPGDPDGHDNRFHVLQEFGDVDVLHPGQHGIGQVGGDVAEQPQGNQVAHHHGEGDRADGEQAAFPTVFGVGQIGEQEGHEKHFAHPPLGNECAFQRRREAVFKDGQHVHGFKLGEDEQDGQCQQGDKDGGEQLGQSADDFQAAAHGKTGDKEHADHHNEKRCTAEKCAHDKFAVLPHDEACHVKVKEHVQTAYHLASDSSEQALAVLDDGLPGKPAVQGVGDEDGERADESRPQR